MGVAAATIAAAAIGAGGAYYASNKQADAAEEASKAMAGGYQQYDPYLLQGNMDLEEIMRNMFSANDQARPWAQNSARQDNKFDLQEALRSYQKMQPYFRQLQAQGGKNALEWSQGNLGSDVISSIGRASAERGIQGGYGFGSQGANSGALANLNLRNLGLTSYDVAQRGTTLGMQLNQNAKALAPAMMGAGDYMFNPQQWLGAQQANLAIEAQNAQYMNQARMANATAGNTLMQNQADQSYASALAQAQMIAAGANQVGSTLSSYAANRQPSTTPAKLV